MAPLFFSLNTEQMVAGITINPKTRKGSPSSIETGSAKIAIIDGNPNAIGKIEDDGTVSVAPGTGADGVGTTIFKVSGDADLGEGVEEIADTVTIVAGMPNAGDMGLGGGTVIDKP
jgi:hypothetical protein